MISLLPQVGSQRKGSRLRRPRQGGGGGGARGVSSPTFSVHSWDSHAIYQYPPLPTTHPAHPAHRPGDDEYGDPGGGGGGGADDPDDVLAAEGGGGGGDDGCAGLGDRFPAARSLQAILCYCDASTLKTPRTILRILLLVKKTIRYVVDISVVALLLKICPGLPADAEVLFRILLSFVPTANDLAVAAVACLLTSESNCRKNYY